MYQSITQQERFGDVADERGASTINESRSTQSSSDPVSFKLTPSEKKKSLASASIFLGLVVAAFYVAATSPDNSPKSLMLIIGSALGIAFERGRFCFYCIFRENIQEKKTRGMQSVLTAIAVGAVGHAVIFGLYLPNPRGEGLPPSAHIAPISEPLVLGAIAFGVGMVLSGACISGHLYRLGQGYFRAIPALIGTLFGFGVGYITWNSLYLNTISNRRTFWLPRSLGYGGTLLVWLVVIGILAVLVKRRGRSGDNAASPTEISTLSRVSLRDLVNGTWGPVITGAVVGGIGILSYLRLEPLGVTAQLSSWSRTYMDSQDLLPDVLHGIDVLKGCVGIISATLTENGMLIIGFTVASFASAFAGGRFKPVRPTLGNGTTALIGGALMGWGSMTSLGCTVGNLLSGTQAFATSGVVFALVTYCAVWASLRLKLNLIFNR